MKRLCLDTSAYSQLRKGHEAVAELVDGAHEILMPVVVLGELRVGFREGSRERDNESGLREFLRDPSVRVIDVDEECAEAYADLKVALRKIGKPVPINDIWIAASACVHGALVVSYDAHFSQLPNVRAKILTAPGRGASPKA